MATPISALVSQGDLKRWGTVGPSPVCNVTEPRPDRPDGGSAAAESTASLVTPKRFVAEPRASCHRNPWLEPNERQVSNW